MSRKNCTDISKTHTSLLVQLGQLHPLETTAPPGTTALPGKPAPPLISLRIENNAVKSAEFSRKVVILQLERFLILIITI